MYYCYFVIISPWKRPFIWTNLNSLHPRLLCAKFGWNWPCGSPEEDFSNSSMYFRNFVIIFPWKYEGSFIWTNVNPLYPRMLCFMFGMNWPSGFGEEDENVKSLRQRRKRQRRQRWRRRTPDKFWSEKLMWAFRSGELKRYNMNFSYISKTPYCWVYNLLWKEFVSFQIYSIFNA